MVAKIRVRWPDGPVCGACFTEATHTRGRCPRCLETRMLPGRSPNRQPICRDCAGITTDLTCTRCNREIERFRAGLCIRCALQDDLTAVLKPGDNLSLHRLISLLTETGRPESIYTYMRPGTRARELLNSIGDRTLPLTHAAFDALPRSTAAEHLRYLLMHHRIMPGRGNEKLVRFEQWLATRVSDLPDDGTAQTIERFATWHHLKRIRDRAADPTVNLETVTHAAKQEITEAAKLLIWLHDTHRIGADELRQTHIDEYLSIGPSTHKHVRNFARWLNRQGRRPYGKLDVPFRPPTFRADDHPTGTYRTRPQLPRLQPRHHIYAPCRPHSAALGSPHQQDRHAQPGRHQQHSRGHVPQAGHHTRRNTRSTNRDVLEPAPGKREPEHHQHEHKLGLFPGTRAGQHIHPATLSERLKVLGIDGQRARNATLRDLTQEVDARTLMDLLGYSPRHHRPARREIGHENV